MIVGTRYKTVNDDILVITHSSRYNCDFKLEHNGRTYRNIRIQVVRDKIREGRLTEVKTKQIFKMTRLKFG